jgi:hypothetical protein
VAECAFTLHFTGTGNYELIIVDPSLYEEDNHRIDGGNKK